MAGKRSGFHARPEVARWFEIYVPRDETVYAVEALARSGEVELELDRRLVAPLNVGPIREALSEFDSFCRQHRIALPGQDARSSRLEGPPEEIVAQAIEYIHHWSERYFRLADQLKTEQEERENLTLLAALLGEMEGENGIERFGHHSEFLCKGIYACPKAHSRISEIEKAFSQSIFHQGVEFVFLAAPPDACDRVEAFFESFACVEVSIPKWLPEGLADQRQAVAQALTALDRRLRETIARIAGHRGSSHLKEVLANVSVLKWFVQNTPKIGSKQRFCHVTGWTTLAEPDGIERLLKGASVHAVARYPQPPVGLLPPLHTLEHWWCRPFDLFNALVQSPGRGEIDPRLVIPLVVPLLFGFMFPDVGHGMIILLLGVALSWHQPLLRFLIPCGFAAMVFGLVFGEVFGIAGALPVYWFHPMDEPLRILAISLVFGASLMLTGMIFSGVEAYWNGEFGNWLLVDAAVLVLYGTLLVGIFVPAVLWLSPPLLLWYLAGSVRVHGRRSARDLLAISGHLLQSAYELAINSFSFIRVGAFALAHAGLTSAIITVAAGAETVWGHWIVLVLGHLFVIAVEGLVVFIQASRLLLFEFFTRFLRAEGRVFQPLNFPGDSNRSPVG